MKCEYHVCQNDARHRRYCSRSCNTKHRIHKTRKLRKQKAVDYLGGSCVRCGYNRCIEALHFHHTQGKNNSIGKMISNWKSWEVIENELNKCDLVCANCHHEIHFSSKTNIQI